MRILGFLSFCCVLTCNFLNIAFANPPFFKTVLSKDTVPNNTSPQAIFFADVVPKNIFLDHQTIVQTAIAQVLEIAEIQKGRSLYAFGRFSDAISVWQEAAQVYATKGDHLHQALCLSYLSLAYQELGKWTPAKLSIQQSIDLLQTNTHAKPKPSPILWAQVLNAQAKFQFHTGQLELAVETWKQAQNFYQQAGDRLGALGSQINQTQALQHLGFYQRSKAQLEEINQQLSTEPNSVLKVNALQSLGVALHALGEQQRSQAVLQQSLTLATQLKIPSKISPILLSLGNSTVASAQELGLSYFQQAEQAATTSLDRIRAQVSQLDVHSNTQNWQRAIALAPPIYQSLTELPTSHSTIYAIVHLAMVLGKIPEPVIPPIKMSRLLATAVQMARELGVLRSEAHALNQWGQLYRQNGQVSEAIQLTQKSLEIARSLQSADLLSQVAWHMGSLLNQQGQRTAAIATYTEAVNALQSLRGDLVTMNPDIQFSFRESIEPVYRELVALLLDGLPSQETLTKARQVIEALQIAELDNYFREACIDAKPTQLETLDRSSAVIYPIILPDRLEVILSLPGQPLENYETRLPKAHIEEHLRKMSGALNPVFSDQERLQLYQQAYDWLIRPAETHLKNSDIKNLVFVLDGLLRNLPMAALHDGHHYLVENYSVAVSLGLQLLAPRSLTAQPLQALAGGLTKARQGFHALPSVDTEISQIATEIPANILLDQTFTSLNLKQAINTTSPPIIHLATHGQFSSAAEQTFILTWDSRMNVKEFSNLLRGRTGKNLTAIELLVLSACQTAQGDDRATLGLAGLAIRSGARSTLATLWSVQDQSTAKFMIQFYQQINQLQVSHTTVADSAMAHPQTTRATAVQQAQLTLLHSKNFSHPFFWAPFVLIGNWL
jgi:CHAT domain-containing protein